MKNPDFIYEGRVDGNFNGRVQVKLRPGLKTFLEFAASNFEVILFTSAVKEYADEVIKVIDPENRFFSHRFYRGDCINLCENFLVKDLRIINNRHLDDVFLIDNSLFNMYSQLGNGYLIYSFYEDPSDTELEVLQRFLVDNKDNLKASLEVKFGFEE